MDFASLMAKEISKSKSPSKSPNPTPASTSEKKYVKRAEVEAARLAAYNEEQERIQREREERSMLKRKHDEEEAERSHEREEKKRRLADESKRRREAEQETKERERRKRLGLPELPDPNQNGDGQEGDEGQEDIDDDHVLQKLRALGEPARLFGESQKGRLKRYRRLIQNSLTPQPQLSQGPIPTTLELVPEVEMKVPSTVPKDEEGKKFLFRQLASYFIMILKEWEVALAQRDQSVKQSFQGKAAYNAMVQSRENMRPLFKKFEKGDLEDGILEPVLEIVRNAQGRRYVDANDGYLRLSIGKAYSPPSPCPVPS